MLAIKNLTKYYNKRKIVDNVSIDINQGSIIGLLGPNGAGKTTCFYMILGLITSDMGDIYLENQNITFLPIHARAKLGIGYLPQEPSVFRKLTVKNNILAILQMLNLSLAEQQLKLQYFLDEFNLNQVQDSLGLSLSGGERRRLEIARTLAVNPKFILLDEPFAGVDPIAINEIKNILLNLAKNNNIGIIITDHNVRETLDICDQAYIMNSGKIIASGSSDAIINHTKVKEVYLGAKFKI